MRPGLRWGIAAILSAGVLFSPVSSAHAEGRVPARVSPTAAGTSVDAGAEANGIDAERVVRQVERNIARRAGVRNIGEARPISPVTGADYAQERPDVAFDGTNFLVVWTTQIVSRNDARTIAATRVTPAGEVLDPQGILVPGADLLYIQNPSVAFGGGSYLVTYENGSNRIFGLRVGTDGLPQGEPFPISDGVSSIPGSMSHAETRPAVAVNGADFLVVWQENDVVGDPGTGTFVSDDNIVGTRVSGTSVLDPAGVFVTQAPRNQTTPDVAGLGTQFLVAWSDTRTGDRKDIYAARVDAALSVLDPTGIIIAEGTGDKHDPAVAAARSTYLVTWSNVGLDGPLQSKIRGSVVSPDSATPGIPRDISDAGPFREPAVASTGRSSFIVVWSTFGQDRIRAAFVGATNPPGGIEVSNGPELANEPIVAVGGGTTFVFWERAGDIVGARLAPDGAVLDPEARMVSVGPNPLGPPVAASNGTVSLVAWRASAGRPSEVRATRVGADGTALDPDGILVASNDGMTAKPAVASDGEDFLVAYNRAAPGGECSVWAVRYSGSTGAALGPVTTDLSSCLTPAVAFDGTNYLIVAGDSGLGPIRAVPVSPTGVKGASFEVVAPPANKDHVTAAGADGASLVAWNEGAVLVSDTGTVTPVALPAAIPNGPTTVASDGTGFLLTRRTSTSYVSTRVDADGTALDPAGIVVSGEEGGVPSVAFNGSWLLVWHDRRTTGSGPGTYGARIRSNGTVVDPQGFVIAAGADSDPSVSAREGGRGWTVAYADQDPATRSDRMFARQVAPK